MRLQLKAILALVFVAAFVSLLVWNHLKPKPSYNGQPLNFYLRNLHLTKPGMLSPLAYEETTNALIHLGLDAAPELVRALGKKDSKIFEALRRKLPGTITRHFPDPMEAWMVRNRAYLLLKNLGPIAKPAVPQLIRLLKNSDLEVCARAAEILGGMGPDAQHAVPILITILNHSDSSVRNSAGTALGRIGPCTPTAVPALVAAMQQRRISYLTAVPALSRLGYRAKEAVPPLSDLVQAEVPFIKLKAANCLALIGPDAEPAIPALIELLHDEESRIRPAAAHALAQIGRSDPVVVAALTNALNDEWWYVRASAAKALGDLGASAKAAIRALQKRQADTNEEVREAAKKSLHQISPELSEMSSRP